VKWGFSNSYPFGTILGTMSREWKWRYSVLALIALLCLATAVESGEQQVKGAACGVFGLPFTVSTCGGKGWARILTGTIKTVANVDDRTTRLQIAPDEIFLGDNSEATAITTQDCLRPQLHPGGGWLFYLVRDVRNNLLIGVRSKPIAVADYDIALLRRLPQLTNAGILIGAVMRVGDTTDTYNPMPLANHKVVAKSVTGGRDYATYTDYKGRFEIELPVGSYELSASTAQGLGDVWHFRPDAPSRILVSEHECLERGFALVTDGRIAGRVMTSDGKPASFVKVAVIPTAPVHPQFTVQADKDGYFEAKGQKAGQFIVGVGLLAPFDSAEWKNRVYYPGVPTKEQARVIELGDGEWRSDIDFTLPPASTSP